MTGGARRPAAGFTNGATPAHAALRCLLFGVRFDRAHGAPDRFKPTAT